MKLIGRLGAMIAGVLGFIVGLIFDAVHSGLTHFLQPNSTTHGFIALLFLVVGLIGALIALFAPRASALLLVVSAVGFIIFVGLLAGILPAIILLIAAGLSYIDRGKVTI
jgi:FtsH-binding integral membrane protein